MSSNWEISGKRRRCLGLLWLWGLRLFYLLYVHTYIYNNIFISLHSMSLYSSNSGDGMIIERKYLWLTTEKRIPFSFLSLWYHHYLIASDFFQEYTLFTFLLFTAFIRLTIFERITFVLFWILSWCLVSSHWSHRHGWMVDLLDILPDFDQFVNYLGYLKVWYSSLFHYLPEFF